MKGIEPSSSAWKAVALPLSYTRTWMLPQKDVHKLPPHFTAATEHEMGGAGFEPAKALPSDLQSDPFDRSGNPPWKIVYLTNIKGQSRSQRRDLNPQPADYKSAALPIELRWPALYLRKPVNITKLTCPARRKSNRLHKNRETRKAAEKSTHLPRKKLARTLMPLFRSTRRTSLEVGSPISGHQAAVLTDLSRAIQSSLPEPPSAACSKHALRSGECALW